MKIKIKALSVNQAWQGKRFKTPKYKAYEEELLWRLPSIDIPDKTPLRLNIEFGIPTLMDIDGGLKCFIDILQKKMGFNDRWIYELNVLKVPVKKGEEYIDYQLTPLICSK